MAFHQPPYLPENGGRDATCSLAEIPMQMCTITVATLASDLRQREIGPQHILRRRRQSAGPLESHRRYPFSEETTLGCAGMQAKCGIQLRHLAPPEKPEKNHSCLE